MLSVDQPLHQRDLLRDEVGCFRLLHWGNQPKSLPILLENLGPLLCKRIQGQFCLPSPADSLVIHISQIAHVLNLSTCRRPNTTKQILNNKSPEITNVGRPIDRRSTGIKLERLPIRSAQRLNLPRCCIEKPNFVHNLSYAFLEKT